MNTSTRRKVGRDAGHGVRVLSSAAVGQVLRRRPRTLSPAELANFQAQSRQAVKDSCASYRAELISHGIITPINTF